MIATPAMVSETKSATCLVCHDSDQAKFMTKVGLEFFRCQGCGLEYTFPQPTDEELGKIYGNYYNAWGLAENAALTEQMKKATFARIISLVSATLPPGGKVLDLGCASGFFLSLAEEKGFDPYGVELSAYGAQKCIERFEESHIFLGEVEDA